MKNLEDTVLTLIILIMVFMIGNLYKRVKKLGIHSISELALLIPNSYED